MEEQVSQPICSIKLEEGAKGEIKATVRIENTSTTSEEDDKIRERVLKQYFELKKELQ
jgi:membrane-associated HD superfamily phosphohydrolase